MNKYLKFIFSVMLLVLLSNISIAKPPIDKVSKLGEYEGYNTKDYKGYSYQSQYVAMPDGIRLATDIFLPKKRAEGEQFPTIIYFVRYARSLQLIKPIRSKGNPLAGAHVPNEEIEFFTSHGYACVIVDLRGSGASFGYRKMEFSNEEVDDMSKMMDWIVDQPWSDKQLATTGISYTGTTAELALSSKHPNLRACIARSNIFDLYEDMTCPGGVSQAPFIQSWKETTQALDYNDFKIFGTIANMVVKGINPVQGDKKRKLLNEAVEGHKKNFDLFTGILQVESRDDKEPINNSSTDAYSIHHRIDDIIASEVPIYRISGWYDGGNVSSAVKGTMSIPNTEKLLIGPWDHGPHDEIDPTTRGHKVNFSVYTEMLRFFDYHMKGIQNGIDQEPKIHYATLGSDQFSSANSWEELNRNRQTYYLSGTNQLTSDKKNIDEGQITYKCDYTVSTTTSARWNSLTPLYKNGHTHYPDRSEVNKKMVCFTGQALVTDQVISGNPEVDLYLSVDATDANFFVYLEDVAPDGSVTYITEGQLRGVFRKTEDTINAPYKRVGPYHTFLDQDRSPMTPNKITRIQIGLQPISYVLEKGHKLQFSIANADANHFLNSKEKPSKMVVYYSQQYKSCIWVSMNNNW